VRAAKPGRIDGLGFGLLTLWLATLQITLDKGQEVDWFNSSWLRWLAITSLVSFVFFVIWELYTEHPVVDLRVLKDRNFAVGCALFALFGAILYGMITLQPLFLQTLMGYTALDAGLTVSPRGAGALAALFLVSIFSTKVSPRVLVGFGLAVLAASAFLLSRITLDVAMRNIIPANVINGFGTGFIFVPLTTMTMGLLRNEQLGNATGIQNLVRNIGGGIGISFVATMLERYAQAHQVIMSAHLSPMQPEFQQRLALTQRLFQPGFSPADAMAHAQAAIYKLMLQQSNYWAAMEIFFVFSCLAATCVPFVFFFNRVKSSRVVAAH
jgi:DHA2 family multidrug resistance protein